MKKNILNTMEKLNIDEGIRGLIKQLWKHNYKTIFSCSGHNKEDNAYLVFKDKTGDGWFEENAENYGLRYKDVNDCCEEVKKIDEEWSKKDPRYFRTNFCWECGHAFNGMQRYNGTLIPNPFKPQTRILNN